MIKSSVIPLDQNSSSLLPIFSIISIPIDGISLFSPNETSKIPTATQKHIPIVVNIPPVIENIFNWDSSSNFADTFFKSVFGRL